MAKQSVRLLQPDDEAALDAFLIKHWSQTMILRSNLRDAGLAYEGKPYQGVYAAAFEDDEIVAAAAHYWNGNLVMQAPVYMGDVLRTVVSASGRKVVELMGPWAQVLASRMILNFNARPTAMPVNPEVLYTLEMENLRVPEGVGKHLQVRRATKDDLALTTDWRVGFMCDAFHIEESETLRAECADDMARWTDKKNLWILQDNGEPVSMSGFNAALPGIAQVGGVYTPQDKRGRGYARAAVAASLLELKNLDRAVLFTEVINIPAQKSYEALGFQRAGDYGILLFVD